MIPEDGVDALIGSFHTQTFVYDEIEDARKNTDTHHFGGHGRTSAVGHRNVADRDLSLSTPLITAPQSLLPLFLELPSQKPFTAFHLSVLVSLSSIFLSQGTHVGHVIACQIIFPEDAFHVIVFLCDGVPLRECGCFYPRAPGFLVLGRQLFAFHRSCSVYCRDVHTIYRKCDESSLIF